MCATLMSPAFGQTSPTGSDGPSASSVTTDIPGGEQGQGAEQGQGGSTVQTGESPPAPRPTVKAVRATSSGARSQGKEGFDASLFNPIEWPEIPDEGKRMTWTSAGAPVPVVQLADAIAVATNWNISTSKALEEEQIRVWATNVTPRELLKIMKNFGIYYDWDPTIKLLRLMTVEEHLKAKYGSISEDVFEIKHAKVQDIENILTSLLSEKGKIVVDPRTGHAMVWDTPDNLKVMKDTLERVDKPLKEAVFHLKHMDADSVVENLTDVMSEVGYAHADQRSNSIIVVDLPSRQEKIGDIIAALDQPLETRTWTKCSFAVQLHILAKVICFRRGARA